MTADGSTPTGSGSNIRIPLLIAGCVVASLCMIACLAVVALLLLPVPWGDVRSGFNPPEVASPTPASAARLPTAASTRAATPLATPGPAIKAGDETLSIKQVIVAEDFAANGRGWKTDQVEGLYMYVEDGRYYVEVRGNNIGQSSFVTAAQTPVASDFVLQVNARTELGPSRNVYGLTYGDSKSGEYYQFTVSDIKQFRIRYATPEQDGTSNWQPFVAWQDSQAPKPPADWHTLTVVKQGQTVTFYQNGRMLYRFEDAPEIGAGRIGVYAGAWEEPVGIAFDNLYFATLR